MKKNSSFIGCILILCLIFCGCSAGGKYNYETVYKEITEHSGMSKDNSFEGIAIPDMETAIEVAEAIYKGMEEEEKRDPCLVYYDTDDEIWIVVFMEQNVVGGDFSIALRKNDGQVVSTWRGK